MNSLATLILHLLGVLSFTCLVQSQDPDFISIDCGISENGDYKDAITNLRYTSDKQFIDTGINMKISPKYNSPTLPQQFSTVRTFPQGIKSCYTLWPRAGKAGNYLIRASFMYGNYDSLNNPPEFDLHIGVGIWDRIKFTNASSIVVKEIIHTPSTDYLYVCLAHSGSGVPFISALELRPLGAKLYERESGSLDLFDRRYMDQTNSAQVRYPDDIYDRIWEQMHFDSISGMRSINTTLDVDVGQYQLPQKVIRSAATPINDQESAFDITWIPPDPEQEFFIIEYFSELKQLQSNETRAFTIKFNDKHHYGPFSPTYLTSTTVRSIRPLSGAELTLNLTRERNSTLPPILNAVELYQIKRFSQLSTKQPDDDAIAKIKSIYSLSKNWQGDPCTPKNYLWDGVVCSYRNSTPPSIISLNLSSNGLRGTIAAPFINLTSVVVLDLSNNRLKGKIPEFFADLQFLKSLNLSGNQLSGSVPKRLQDKANTGVLHLSLQNNPDLCQSESCMTKTKMIAIIVSVALSVILVALAVYWYFFPRTGRGCFKQKETTARRTGAFQFSYDEVKSMTNNFHKQVGQGAFGTVYEGFLKNGTRVAVKKLSLTEEASQQNETEVELLMSIRHKNLVSLIGYCEKKNDLALIYEYMVNGDLKDFLSANKSLSWKKRLEIAIGAAQGLEYLHNGCKPQIVHRDVKPANILLDENLNAKVADFGLSKSFPTGHDRTYVSTRVVGTIGYLDPQYHLTGHLTDKSDVYSFGVVLLQLITGREPTVRTEVHVGLVQWVRSMVNGQTDVLNIVDQSIQEKLNPNKVWSVIKLAMACSEATRIQRPTMRYVVTELEKYLALENNAVEKGFYNDRNDINSVNTDGSFTSLEAR